MGIDFISLPSFNVSTADILRGINLLLRAVHAFGVDFIGDAFGEIFITLRAFFLGISSVFTIFSSPSTNFTWATFKFGICLTDEHEGPCSPAKTSQTQPSLTSKWLKHARLIFSTVTSSYSKGTNSRAPTLVYFWALPNTSALKRCTVTHSSSKILTPEVFFLDPLFSVIFFLKFFQAARSPMFILDVEPAHMQIFTKASTCYSAVQCIMVYCDSDRPIKFHFNFILIVKCF